MDWWPFAVSAACAGMLMPLAIHVRSIGHGEHHGVQRLHDVPTSRLGGIVVVVACAVTMAHGPVGTGGTWHSRACR